MGILYKASLLVFAITMVTGKKDSIKKTAQPQHAPLREQGKRGLEQLTGNPVAFLTYPSSFQRDQGTAWTPITEAPRVIIGGINAQETRDYMINENRGLANQDDHGVNRNLNFGHTPLQAVLIGQGNKGSQIRYSGFRGHNPSNGAQITSHSGHGSFGGYHKQNRGISGYGFPGHGGTGNIGTQGLRMSGHGHLVGVHDGKGHTLRGPAFFQHGHGSFPTRDGPIGGTFFGKHGGPYAIGRGTTGAHSISGDVHSSAGHISFNTKVPGEQGYPAHAPKTNGNQGQGDGLVAAVYSIHGLDSQVAKGQGTHGVKVPNGHYHTGIRPSEGYLVHGGNSAQETERPLEYSSFGSKGQSNTGNVGHALSGHGIFHGGHNANHGGLGHETIGNGVVGVQNIHGGYETYGLAGSSGFGGNGNFGSGQDHPNLGAYGGIGYGEGQGNHGGQHGGSYVHGVSGSGHTLGGQGGHGGISSGEHLTEGHKGNSISHGKHSGRAHMGHGSGETSFTGHGSREHNTATSHVGYSGKEHGSEESSNAGSSHGSDDGSQSTEHGSTGSGQHHTSRGESHGKATSFQNFVIHSYNPVPVDFKYPSKTDSKGHSSEDHKSAEVTIENNNINEH